MNEVIDSLLNHRSIRKYSDKAIEPEVLNQILEAGIRAPSAGNLQNYSLMVLDDKEKMDLIGKEAGAPFLTNAPMCIVAFVDYYRFKRLTEMFDAPYPFDGADSIFIGMWDAIVALHNIQVAAEGMGLGTCYIGLILETDNKKLLGLPDHVFAAGMMSIGYPGNVPEKRTRLPLESVLHRNEYREPSDEELKDWYKDWLAKWPNFYDRLSDEKKKHWKEELGVSNNVQYVTKTVYTVDRLTEWSKKIEQNIRNAKYKF